MLSAAAAEEALALAAIYGDDCVESEPATGSVCVSLREHHVTLRFTLPAGYPDAGGPTVEVALRHRAEDAARLVSGLAQFVAPGECALFAYCEWVKEQLQSAAPEPPAKQPKPVPRTRAASPGAVARAALVAARVKRGEPVTERKSVFLAHCCEVHTPEQVQAFVAHLLTDKRIAAATHNVLAYRLEPRPGVFAADCDDDGESAAGGRLMHLLTVLRAANVAVVVSRWYGGIQLGADRFKIFNQAARDVLDAHGFLPPRA